jgi:hypothetical protein
MNMAGASRQKKLTIQVLTAQIDRRRGVDRPTGILVWFR